MLISFVVPVYNNAADFVGCLQSLQPLLDEGIADVVAVDDGSDMPLVVDSEGVVVLHLPHRGVAAARNAGLLAATGDFVWFVDADDSIDTDGIDLLVDDLKKMPDDVPFFHIGRMATVKRTGKYEECGNPDGSRTEDCVPLNLLRPRCSIVDHTTNIVRRTWLQEHGDLRYPEGMSLLEDTVLSLSVIEAAGRCFANSTYRFYRHHIYRASATAGAWSAERSRRFTVDICRFFGFLGEYCKKHDAEAIMAFYERYRYVYLRVVAVKGCPTDDLKRVLDCLGPLRRCPRWVYMVFAFMCRLFRCRK